MVTEPPVAQSVAQLDPVGQMFCMACRSHRTFGRFRLPVRSSFGYNPVRSFCLRLPTCFIYHGLFFFENRLLSFDSRFEFPLTTPCTPRDLLKVTQGAHNVGGSSSTGYSRRSSPVREVEDRLQLFSPSWFATSTAHGRVAGNIFNLRRSLLQVCVVLRRSICPGDPFLGT